MAQPRDKGGEEVHGQEQGHHQLDRHGHEEGGHDDGDGGTGGHRLADSGQVGRFRAIGYLCLCPHRPLDSLVNVPPVHHD